MIFYGREKERASLHRFMDKPGGQVCLIYGRRRVGKSELIKQTLRESKISSLYYTCKQTTEMNNVESIAALISDHYHFPKLSFDNFEALLSFLFEQSIEKPMVLVLDEYPYLRNAVTGLDSILQSLIDQYRDTTQLKLIFCGSFVEIMRSLLERDNPLYGRVDLTIDLKPMDYYDAALFYQGFSNEDKVRLFSVFGGIPYYNRLIDHSLSVRENIIALIASEGARLENEVMMYLKSEISKITNANEVFEALAKGCCRYSDILSQSHVSSSPTLAGVLDRLIKMEVVSKEAPINDPVNKRKTFYTISDNLSLFFYRYIFRYASQMSVMDSDVFFDRYIAEDFESSYVPRIFESIGRQYLIRQNRMSQLPVIFDKIGKYWYDDPNTHTNGEFDIVTQDEKGYIFYEVKFRQEPMTLKQIQEEIRQVEQTGLNCYAYGFISRSGFDVEPEKEWRLITLDDLYS